MVDAYYHCTVAHGRGVRNTGKGARRHTAVIAVVATTVVVIAVTGTAVMIGFRTDGLPSAPVSPAVSGPEMEEPGAAEAPVGDRSVDMTPVAPAPQADAAEQTPAVALETVRPGPLERSLARWAPAATEPTASTAAVSSTRGVPVRAVLADADALPDRVARLAAEARWDELAAAVAAPEFVVEEVERTFTAAGATAESPQWVYAVDERELNEYDGSVGEYLVRYRDGTVLLRLYRDGEEITDLEAVAPVPAP